MKSILITAATLCLATVVWTQSALAECILNIPPNLTNFSNPPASLVFCPLGDGDSMSQATQNNNPVDATIEVQLLDDMGQPIANYPWEDIWLEIDGLCACGGSNGFIANNNSNSTGNFTFSATFSGGGYASNPVIKVIVAGGLCETSAPLNINYKSYDFDCNGIVDNADVIIMKAMPKTLGDFSADLDDSHSENPGMVDAQLMAEHVYPPLTHSCP